MATITIELVDYKDGLPTRGKYKVDEVRVSIGAPPATTRDKHTAALLRIAAEILDKAGRKLEDGKANGEYTRHLKIPNGDWG